MEDQSIYLYPEIRLFPRFPYHAFLFRLRPLSPAAGNQPELLSLFLDSQQEYAMVLEDHRLVPGSPLRDVVSAFHSRPATMSAR